MRAESSAVSSGSSAPASVLWTKRRVLVTGGAGFLGQHVVSRLKALGAPSVFSPRSRDYDLTHETATQRLFQEHPADIVIHLAARSGGIGYNAASPGKLLYDNIMVGTLMMEYARLSGVKKYVQVGTATAYPKNAPVPFKEDSLWSGAIEPDHQAHALPKLLSLAQAQGYRRQYGLAAITVIPVNLYGPGDRFDPETARVIPALIFKCLKALREKQPEVVIWGSGKPTRDFLFVEDAAEGILLAAQSYDQPEPINLGSGREVSINELARTIARLTGFKGNLRFDSSRPEGQPRQYVDASRAREILGFQPRINLEEGLKRTIAWCRSQSVLA